VAPSGDPGESRTSLETGSPCTLIDIRRVTGRTEAGGRVARQARPSSAPPAPPGSSAPCRARARLEDLLVDARLAAWASRNRWAEGTAGAIADVGRLVAGVPPDRVAR
jgi:hypothetical protein